MQNSQLYWGALATIIASLIAASIALLSLIISKEQKVSEFRQAWIDALREEIATIITHLNVLRGYATVHQGTKLEAFNKVEPHFLLLNSAITKIQLRLNQQEEKSKKVTRLMERLEGDFEPHNTRMTREESAALEKEFIEACRDLLKDEWNTVKQGEPIYKNTVRTVKCVFALAVFVAVLAAAEYSRTL